MARRTFDVIDICEILVHWYAGRSKNELAGSLGLSRNTVRKYVAAAEAAGMVPGGPEVSAERWRAMAREWFPELADTRLRQVTWPAIGEHRDYIAEQMKAGVTAATIHQRLRDERGLAVSVASLRRYVAANLPEEVRRAQVTVLRLVPAEPGLEALCGIPHSASAPGGDGGRQISSSASRDRSGNCARTYRRTLATLAARPASSRSRCQITDTGTTPSSSPLRSW